MILRLTFWLLHRNSVRVLHVLDNNLLPVSVVMLVGESTSMSTSSNSPDEKQTVIPRDAAYWAKQTIIHSDQCT